MNKPQIIIAPNGEELVVLSRREYDALLAAAADTEEDERDLAVYDQRKAELAGVDLLPAEISASLLRGETRLAAVRKYRRMKQTDVAAQLGRAQGYLSDLESGRRRGAAATVRKLAQIYDVPVGWLD